MSESAALVIALLVVGWATFSGMLGRHSVTGPLVFVTVGYLLANPDWGPVTVDIEVDGLHVLAEVTLALVLPWALAGFIGAWLAPTDACA